MESFRSKYEDLIAKEADIRKYLRKSKEQLKRPREKVLLWLEDVGRLKGKVENFEELLVKNSATCFCLSCTSLNSKHPKSVIEMFKEVDRLYKTCQFPDGLLLQQSVGRAELVPIPETGNMSVNEKIWDSLMDNRIGKIGIYGMAGVGKTTCIAWINNQLVTKENYFDIIIWVFVSMDFSLKRIQDNIAQRLGLNLSMYEDEEIRAVHLHERLTQAQQYLIIFYDVWEPIPLEKLGIHEPNRENGCKIVLTTRSMEICHKMGTHKNIKIEVLSKKEAWDLFVSNVGDLVLTPEIQHIAKELVDKCGSLPLAIIMIGRALKGAENINILKEALTGMESASPSNKTMQELFMYLKFSFDSLENATARECFLYCAFFPQGYKFETTELIAYWMADNLIHNEEDILTEIDEGLRIIRVLKDASMLELFTNRSGDEFLTVHNLYRGLAINILQEKPGILIKAGLGLMESLNEREWSQRRKISLMKNGIEMLVNNPDCPNLLSLFLLGNPLSNNISSSFFSKMPALQVLDISYSRITELSSSVSQLTNLRALFLKHCTKLKKLPSLEKLIQLRALNLCGSSIKELPEGMDQLVNLRSLDFSETTSLENIEAGVIQKLSCLEELHMQGSRFCKMDSPIAAKIFKELRCLKSLTILTLSSAGFEDHLDTIMCLQEQNLKSFSINVYGSTLDIIEDVQ